MSEKEFCCKKCGKQFLKKSRTLNSCLDCRTIKKLCENCHKEFSFISLGKINNLKRIFCGIPCALSFRGNQPHVKEAFNKRLEGIRGAGLKGRKSPQSSERMRSNNPMKSPETREKMRQSLTGRTFLARGGNSQLTKPQILLAELLNLKTEYPIPTCKVKHLFESLPNCYKVDLAIPEIKLAIEVDGKTHKLKKWKYLDKRKTEVLQALGWKVIRFWNEEVLTKTETVLAIIQDEIKSN